MNKVKTILIFALIVIAVILNFRFKLARHKLTRLQKEQSSKDFLDSKLKSQIVIENEKIIYRTKKQSSKGLNLKDKSEEQSSNGTELELCSSVNITTRYLPPEGNAKIDVDLDGNTTISVKNKGLVFEPEILAFATFLGVKLGLGARIAYWNRYGVSVGLDLNANFRDTNNFRCFVGVDRRLIDVLPLIKNTTIGVSYDGDFGIYFSVFF